VAGQETAHEGWDTGPSISPAPRENVSYLSNSIHIKHMFVVHRF